MTVGFAGRAKIASITHQGRIKFLQCLRGEPARVKSTMFANILIVAQMIGYRSKACWLRITSSERLEEQKGFKRSVSRQRRHPPLPARPATGGRIWGDRGHGGKRAIGENARRDQFKVMNF